MSEASSNLPLPLPLKDKERKDSEESGSHDVVIEEPQVSPLRAYTMKEVSFHCDYQSCWVVIMDKVYDVTKFIPEVRRLVTIN